MLRFFLLTFALSWSCFTAAISLEGPLQSALLLLGTIAPSLSALGLMAFESGSTGLRAFFSARFKWPASARWYVFAILYFPAVKLAAALAHRLITSAWPRFGTEPLYIIALAIPLSTPVQAGEEIGWRGYALPRMAARMGFRMASVVLGVIWSVWHLPLFYLPGADKFGQSFPVYLAGTVTLSVAITWLYIRTDGSLWMTMLMHSAVNQTTGIVPTLVEGARNVFGLSHSLIAWLTVTTMSAAAAYFLVSMPGRSTATNVEVPWKLNSK